MDDPRRARRREGPTATPVTPGPGLRRRIAGAMGWWMRLFLVSLVVVRFVDLPAWLELAGPILVFALAWVRPRGEPGRRPEVVAPPVRGRWTAVNSPATKVPSHGIRAYGQTHAIDVLHPRPPGGDGKVGWGVGMRRPEAFSTFGEPVHAVADGVVVSTSTNQRDHRSRESWPSLAYMLTVEGAARELGGARFVLGNHVVVDHGDGVYSAYAHLRRGSVTVDPGDAVRTGQPLAEVGNSGNTTEPHLHLQLMDAPAVTAAAGVPFRWHDIDIRPGEVDRTHLRREPTTTIEPGLPADGQVFTAGAGPAAIR